MADPGYFLVPIASLGSPKTRTEAQYRASEIEAWTTATISRGLRLADVPDECREAVADLRVRRLGMIRAIATAKVDPAG